MTQLDDTLDELKALLPRLTRQSDIEGAARPYCAAFYRLYWHVRDGMGRDDYSRVLSFLSQSEPIMRRALPYLGQDLLDRIEVGLGQSFQGTEWIQLCELRSTYSALKELYEDYLPVNSIMPDALDVDDLLESKGEHNAIQDAGMTPAHFPETHWWWRMH